jgi:hypothetical protein
MELVGLSQQTRKLSYQLECTEPHRYVESRDI